MEQHLFEYFQNPGHTCFVEDISLTFIDKTDPLTSTKHENYWRQTLEFFALRGLNIDESA